MFQVRVRSMVAQNLIAGERADARDVLLALRVHVRSLGLARRIAIEEIGRVHTERIEEWFARQPEVQDYVRARSTPRAQASALRAAAAARAQAFPGVDFEAVKWHAILVGKGTRTVG